MRSSHSGSRQPASRNGSSSRTAARPAPSPVASRSRSSTVGSARPVDRCSNRKPCSNRGPSSSWTRRCERSGIPTRSDPARSQWTRRAACWAMIPLGNIAAAGLPSSSATSCSRRATAPRSAYTSHCSMPSSSAACARSPHRLLGRATRRPEDVALAAPGDLAEPVEDLVHVSIRVPGGHALVDGLDQLLQGGEGDALRVGAERQPGDAELLEAAGRRHARGPDEGEAAGTEGLDEGVHLVLVEQPRHEDDGCSHVEVGPAARDRVLQHVAPVLVTGADESVGAGVEHEVGHSLRLRGPDGRGHGAGGLGDRLQLVLEVGADDAEPDGTPDGARRVAVPRLEVGRHGEVDRGRDPADHLEHQVDGDLLAVGVSVGRRDAVAGRRDGSGVPSTAATARALATSQTLTRVRIFGRAVELEQTGGVRGSGHPSIQPLSPRRRARRRRGCGGYAGGSR